MQYIQSINTKESMIEIIKSMRNHPNIIIFQEFELPYTITFSDSVKVIEDAINYTNFDEFRVKLAKNEFMCVFTHSKCQHAIKQLLSQKFDQLYKLICWQQRNNIKGLLSYWPGKITSITSTIIQGLVNLELLIRILPIKKNYKCYYNLIRETYKYFDGHYKFFNEWIDSIQICLNLFESNENEFAILENMTKDSLKKVAKAYICEFVISSGKKFDTLINLLPFKQNKFYDVDYLNHLSDNEVQIWTSQYSNILELFFEINIEYIEFDDPTMKPFDLCKFLCTYSLDELAELLDLATENNGDKYINSRNTELLRLRIILGALLMGQDNSDSFSYIKTNLLKFDKCLHKYKQYLVMYYDIAKKTISYIQDYALREAKSNSRIHLIFKKSTVALIDLNNKMTINIIIEDKNDIKNNTLSKYYIDDLCNWAKIEHKIRNTKITSETDSQNMLKKISLLIDLAKNLNSINDEFDQLILNGLPKIKTNILNKIQMDEDNIDNVMNFKNALIQYGNEWISKYKMLLHACPLYSFIPLKQLFLLFKTRNQCHWETQNIARLLNIDDPNQLIISKSFENSQPRNQETFESYFQRAKKCISFLQGMLMELENKTTQPKSDKAIYIIKDPNIFDGIFMILKASDKTIEKAYYLFCTKKNFPIRNYCINREKCVFKSCLHYCISRKTSTNISRKT